MHCSWVSNPYEIGLALNCYTLSPVPAYGLNGPWNGDEYPDDTHKIKTYIAQYLYKDATAVDESVISAAVWLMMLNHSCNYSDTITSAKKYLMELMLHNYDSQI